MDRLPYTIHLRKNVYFQEDPAFGGKRRKLVAGDVVCTTRISTPD
jgi:hypothetical protein